MCVVTGSKKEKKKKSKKWPMAGRKGRERGKETPIREEEEEESVDDKLRSQMLMF